MHILQSAFEITFYKLVKKLTAMRQTKLTALGSLLACCLFAFSFSQAQESSPALRIKGSVKGTDGATLQGVTIALSSRKTVATITDASGNFTLNIPAGRNSKDLQLEFSYIGFQTKLVKLDPGQTEITVAL